MCGVIGILLADREAQVSPELYDGLTILQHRGQDAAGIATSDGRKVFLRKDKGLVRICPAAAVLYAVHTGSSTFSFLLCLLLSGIGGVLV